MLLLMSDMSSNSDYITPISDIVFEERFVNTFYKKVSKDLKPDMKNTQADLGTLRIIIISIHANLTSKTN